MSIAIDITATPQMTFVKPEHDPRETRWGLNAGQRRISLSPLSTGIRQGFVPLGKWFPIATFTTPRENCTLDEYKEKEFLVEITADEAEAEIRAAIDKWGLQVAFHGQNDPVYMTVLSEVVLPPLSAIRTTFDELNTQIVAPIPATCPAEDERDLGEPREYCATCHLDWLKSPECEAFLADAAANGREVQIASSDGIETRRVTPRHSDLLKARELHIKALEIYRRQASDDWARIVSEIKKGRLDINEAEHFLRKDLHQSTPDNKEMDAVKVIANAQSDSTSQVIAVLVENQRIMQEQMAAQSAITNQVLQTIAGLAARPVNPVPVEPTASQKPAKAAAKKAGEAEE